MEKELRVVQEVEMEGEEAGGGSGVAPGKKNKKRKRMWNKKKVNEPVVPSELGFFF